MITLNYTKTNGNNGTSIEDCPFGIKSSSGKPVKIGSGACTEECYWFKKKYNFSQRIDCKGDEKPL